MSDALLLLALRAKGLASVAKLAEALGEAERDTEARARELISGDLCTETRAGLKLTAAGRAHVAALVEAERAAVDADTLQSAYAEFLTLDAELKRTLTAWQLRDPATPNDHTDPDYDRRVLRQLATLHIRTGLLLEDLAKLLPRLTRYAARLDTAHTRIIEGDPTFIASPLTDSYHTVWFELHEDLLALTGNEREA